MVTNSSPRVRRPFRYRGYICKPALNPDGKVHMLSGHYTSWAVQKDEPSTLEDVLTGIAGIHHGKHPCEWAMIEVFDTITGEQVYYKKPEFIDTAFELVPKEEGPAPKPLALAVRTPVVQPSSPSRTVVSIPVREEGLVRTHITGKIKIFKARGP